MPVTNDFFTAAPQSFASAAAMVSDILAATPDIDDKPVASGGSRQAGPQGDDADAPTSVSDQAVDGEEPTSSDNAPITPDFFTARPKKSLFRRS